MKLFSVILLMFLIVGCSDSDSGEQTDQLIGTWILQEFEDTAANSSTSIPDNAKDILIVFSTSDFNGTTGSNEYMGRYSADSKKLTFLELSRSEAGETEWGNKYFDAFRTAYDQENQKYIMSYLVSGNILKINYSDSKNLIFEKTGN